MFSKSPVHISIMLVTAIMGLMMALQFRVVNQMPAGIPTDRAKEIIAELKQVNREKENLTREIGDLEYKLEQLNRGKSEAMLALESELKKVRMSAGLVTVNGPGVEVVLDNPELQESQVPPELSVIQDQDLLSLVNELWGAGAEAISINGQRIVATSEIRLAAPFININTTRVVPPYQVLAIGNPETLAENLELPGGLLEYFRDMGFQVTVEKHDELTIPAYSPR
ncbi:DUF881 domain-containing protein [Desulfallas sp. Bu1-1]|jgi:uncharacterized protein YlxW (UPF0749 family)|uniref:DUF881 domain-containing protein n=1 Tax=Desulfallas sp. Bu1-1 TaxID=2787620 RepID=UPI0018A0A40B|nr:DUF881 domain-containing protein [Desulfallas sp. Bu1-1]MBF7083220.1 DUF881 domain-containing protein [Desulfallas sp. Bu1-1]